MASSFTTSHTEQGFYPASQFGILRKLTQAPKCLNFADYLLLSDNFYRIGWSFNTYRRVKNIIVVMEWVPDWDTLESRTDSKQAGLPREQLQRLRKAFDLFDTNGTNSIEVSELRDLLRAVDVDVSGEEGDAVVELVMKSIIEFQRNRTAAGGTTRGNNCSQTRGKAARGVHGATNVDRRDSWNDMTSNDETRREVIDEFDPFSPVTRDAAQHVPPRPLSPSNSSRSLIITGGGVPNSSASEVGRSSRIKPTGFPPRSRNEIADPADMFGLFPDTSLSVTQSLATSPRPAKYITPIRGDNVNVSTPSSQCSTNLLDIDFPGSTTLTSETAILINTEAPCTAIPTTSTSQEGLGSGVRLSFEDIREALSQQALYTLQQGRYFVALSLAEAEAVRAALHVMQADMSPSLVHGKRTMVALRNLSARFQPLDASQQFYEARERRVALLGYQQQTANACYRYLNSEIQYTERNISLLLRTLQSSKCEARQEFFFELRRCRRRKHKVNWQETPLVRLFSSPDDLAQLQFRTTAARLRQKLKQRGLSVSDGFRAFDINRNGVVSIAHLYGGLKWLGIHLTHQEMKDIVRFVDLDNDGIINEPDFVKAFGDPADIDSFKSVTAAQTGSTLEGPTRSLVSPEEWKQLGGAKRATVAVEVYSRVKGKLQPHLNFRKIWEGVLGGGRSGEGVCLSIWQPDQLDGKSRGVMRKNRERVCLGCFIAEGSDIMKFANAKGEGACPMVYEFVDPTASSLTESCDLKCFVDILLPHPVRYRLLWRQSSSSRVARSSHNILCLWSAVPPTADFSSIGLYATTSDTPPPLSAMRCVPTKWLHICTVPPILLWEDMDSLKSHERLAVLSVTKARLLGVSLGGTDTGVTGGRGRTSVGGRGRGHVAWMELKSSTFSFETDTRGADRRRRSNDLLSAGQLEDSASDDAGIPCLAPRRTGGGGLFAGIKI
eukprot:GHVQ01028265.1.p1 GENE.GHVQ01028265.1~~GHVQ01028265.1.p1  ORF type:complete len:1005 (+),score=159.53 GHVQ01028265.1:173-3016(+)